MKITYMQKLSEVLAIVVCLVTFLLLSYLQGQT